MARNDKYASIFSQKIATAGATSVSEEIQTGVSLGSKIGMIIDSIDYFYDIDVLSDFIAGVATDYYQISIASQDDEFGLDNSRVIDQILYLNYINGTPANSMILPQPMRRDFIPPRIYAGPKIYINGLGTAAISGGYFYVRGSFRYVDLTSTEYLEIAEAFVLTS